MIAYVITESKWDAELLRRLLPLGLSNEVEFLEGGGLDGVMSMARSVIVSSRKPVAVLVNADSSDSQVINSRRQNMEEFVGSVAKNVPIGILMAVPQIEYVFFEADGPLRRILPSYDSNPLLKDLAQSNARQALQVLDPVSSFPDLREKLLHEIADEDLPAFWQTKIVRELIEFLRGCQARRVKIRLEIGPGIPSDLQSLKDANGWKALLGAFVKVLTSEYWTAGGTASASSGDVTVHVDPLKYNVHMEPPGGLPTTFVIELEGEARTEKDDQDKLAKAAT